MKKIQSYQSDIKTVKQARVALVGRVGAGKSSFFNSISSTFRGNMTSQAIAGTAASSVTTQVPAQDLWPFRGAWPLRRVKGPIKVSNHWLLAKMNEFVWLSYTSCLFCSSAPTPSRQGKAVEPSLWSCVTQWGWRKNLILVWTLRTWSTSTRVT